MAESLVFQNLQNQRKGLHKYTDKFVTSPELAQELFRINCNLTGTNRAGMPIGLKQKGKTTKKGELCVKRKGSVLVLTWKDKTPVNMLSTFHNGRRDCVWV